MIDTAGSDFDTVLYVRNAACDGAELACNDDSVGATSAVFVTLGAGQSVVVVVDGYGGSSGNFNLHIAFVAPTSMPSPTPTHAPNVRQLTFAEYPSRPRISDDGSVVVLEVHHTGKDVFLVATGGGNPRRLTNSLGGACLNPHPSADGNRVAMNCDLSGVCDYDREDFGNFNIFLFDRTDLKPITSAPATVYNDAPDISADGQTIVFPSVGNYTGQNITGRSQLFLAREGQSLRQITSGSGDSFESKISADGRRVLFRRTQSLRDFNPAQNGCDNAPQRDETIGTLYIYDDRSGDTTQVNSAGAASARFSRDGQWVVFSSQDDLVGQNPGRRSQLYVQRIGGAVRQLTQVDDAQTFFSGFTVNGDGSRIAAVVYKAIEPFDDPLSGEAVLFTSAGRRALPGVPLDARDLSFDNAGHFLAFLSREDLTGDNPSRYRQLFVAEIPVDPGTPVPTATATNTPSPTSTPRPVPSLGPCVGDCDNNSKVTVDELVKGVNIALGNVLLDQCQDFNCNHNGRVTVDCLVKAVNAALNGCVSETIMR